MNGHAIRRRGMMLMVVVLAMTLVGGLLSVLAAAVAGRYRDRQAEQVHVAARTIADSASEYARACLNNWGQVPADAPIRLDVIEILPPGMSGDATITLRAEAGRQYYHITTRVARGIYAADEQCDIPIHQASSTTAPPVTLPAAIGR